MESNCGHKCVYCKQRNMYSILQTMFQVFFFAKFFQYVFFFCDSSLHFTFFFFAVLLSICAVYFFAFHLVLFDTGWLGICEGVTAQSLPPAWFAPHRSVHAQHCQACDHHVTFSGPAHPYTASLFLALPDSFHLPFLDKPYCIKFIYQASSYVKKNN